MTNSESNQFRRNPITGHWSIIVQQQNDLEELLARIRPRKKPSKDQKSRCQFCEGFETKTPSEIYAIRKEGAAVDKPGWDVRVIPNIQPILQIHGELNNRGIGIYDVLDGIGAHELVIEYPQHDVQLMNMDNDQLVKVLNTYRERILDLKKDERFRYVLLHKNFGDGHEEVLFHSHSHIIATPITPTRVKTELLNAMEHFQYKERCLFCDIIHQELNDDERIIHQNDKFLAMAPFASRSPFEVCILPKQHETFFEWNEDYRQLAEILQSILTKINNILYHPNYVMVLHSGPNVATGKLRGYWKTLDRDYHWHIEITPRFRGYTSFEIGSGFHINMVSPENAAAILKSENLNS
ncbi:MAG: galactose-1-phosphate uridylyltransferase [bacterium]